MSLLPGYNPHRLITLMRAAVERCQLDLSGHVILTEAASGAYVVTPVLAAIAGADHVYALTRSTRYGSVVEVTAQTLELAASVGRQHRIEIITQKSQQVVSKVDIVTNSGHVRPIDATMIAWLKTTAVISLMYEAWEFRSDDIDLAACRQYGIPVGGVNERHESVDVFSFLGIAALKMLIDAGISVYGSRIALLCDNPFSPFIESCLMSVGATADRYESLVQVAPNTSYDAILVALQPRSEPVLSAVDAAMIAEHWPGAVVAQFWGDMDRVALLSAHVFVWPLEAPSPGHMGILLSEVGPEPIVRLQAGGLKAAEVLARRVFHPNYYSDYVEVI